MSLANVLKKLKKEASGKAAEQGHQIGRYALSQIPNSSFKVFCAKCYNCGLGVSIQPAIDRGVHRVQGPALTLICRSH